MASKNAIKVELVDGILSDFKTDVIVDSTNRNLVLKFGKLSRDLSEKAGRELQAECSRKYPNGIQLGEIAVTGGYKLGCKKVYHGSLPGWDSPEVDDAKQVLCQLVCACLNQAHKDKMESIAFPALGCGFLAYPPDVAAQTMLNCVVKFESQQKNSFLTKVSIVIFTNGGDWKHIKQAFHKELYGSQNDKAADASQRSIKDVLKSMTLTPKKNTIKTSFADTCMKLRANNSCKHVLECGHVCLGYKDEDECPPCIQSTCIEDGQQSSDDECIIYYTDPLQAAPIIQLQCGHIFHLHCVERVLENRWVGPRVTFNFLLCPLCKTEIYHPKLEEILEPMLELKEDVEQKARERLQVNYDTYYDNGYDDDYWMLGDDDSTDDEVNDNQEDIVDDHNGDNNEEENGDDDDDDYSAIHDPNTEMEKMCFYLCYKCQRPYYGGEVQCEQQVGAETRRFDPKNLVCGACSNIEGVKECKKHGDKYIEYKCLFCCSVAGYFCFGRNHYCIDCHDNYMGCVRNDIDCPVGPGTKPLKSTECPLMVKHPPTGVEFSLGCGMCRVKPDKHKAGKKPVTSDSVHGRKRPKSKYRGAEKS